MESEPITDQITEIQDALIEFLLSKNYEQPIFLAKQAVSTLSDRLLEQLKTAQQ